MENKGNDHCNNGKFDLNVEKKDDKLSEGYEQQLLGVGIAFFVLSIIFGLYFIGSGLDSHDAESILFGLIILTSGYLIFSLLNVFREISITLKKINIKL